MRETANWPEGKEFETLAVDDAHHPQRHPACRVRRRGSALDELRELLPAMVRLARGWPCCRR